MAVISGGTTLIDNGALDAGVPTGSLILLSTQTASASANISFTTGLDSTYNSYVFKFINIHPATDDTSFGFNFSTDAGSNYNVAKTTTSFRARHTEDDTDTLLEYRTADDLAQGTGNKKLCGGIGNGNDESLSGTLTVYNPSSLTFVKHFISNCNEYSSSDFSIQYLHAGYGNTTSAVNAVRFQMSSGNIDDGIIKLYGVK